MKNVVYRDAGVYPTADLQSLSVGLDIGFEELRNMTDMYIALHGAKDNSGYIPYHVRRMARCSVESFHHRYGLEEEAKSEADSTAPKSDDGIMKTIEKIITKIIDTIKEIWKSIMNLFGAGEPDAKKAAESDKETKAEVSKVPASDWVKAEWEKEAKKMIWFLSRDFAGKNIASINKLVEVLKETTDKSGILETLNTAAANVKGAKEGAAGTGESKGGELIDAIALTYGKFKEYSSELTNALNMKVETLPGIEEKIGGLKDPDFGGVILCSYNNVMWMKLTKGDDDLTKSESGSIEYNKELLNEFKIDKIHLEKALENSETFSTNFSGFLEVLKNLKLTTLEEKITAALTKYQKELEALIEKENDPEFMKTFKVTQSAVSSQLNLVTKTALAIGGLVNGNGGMLIQTQKMKEAIIKNIKTRIKHQEVIDKMKSK